MIKEAINNNIRIIRMMIWYIVSIVIGNLMKVLPKLIYLSVPIRPKLMEERALIGEKNTENTHIILY